MFERFDSKFALLKKRSPEARRFPMVVVPESAKELISVGASATVRSTIQS